MKPELVDWGGQLVPRSLVEDVQVKGACPECGGLGSIPEQIDRDRWPTMVPCHRCQIFCRECKRHVDKSGHPCPAQKGGANE